MARLTDRFQVGALLPDDAASAELLRLLDRVCPGGSTYHVLTHIPEQCEDVYTILIDDHSVASFEVPRGHDPMILTHLKIRSFGAFRSEIGQGKERARLDRAAEQARKLLGSLPVLRS
ncbi:hypothetical protein [Bradyrhizobium oligotrophicum]|uniref:hypothetical protein n=1 Tax=Bradyrhizobium oligotrophicum TaxID=44255 RepID=UPI003EBDF61D